MTKQNKIWYNKTNNFIFIAIHIMNTSPETWSINHKNTTSQTIPKKTWNPFEWYRERQFKKTEQRAERKLKTFGFIENNEDISKFINKVFKSFDEQADNYVQFDKKSPPIDFSGELSEELVNNIWDALYKKNTPLQPLHENTNVKNVITLKNSLTKWYHEIPWYYKNKILQIIIESDIPDINTKENIKNIIKEKNINTQDLISDTISIQNVMTQKIVDVLAPQQSAAYGFIMHFDFTKNLKTNQMILNEIENRQKIYMGNQEYIVIWGQWDDRILKWIDGKIFRQTKSKIERLL